MIRLFQPNPIWSQQPWNNWLPQWQLNDQFFFCYFNHFVFTGNPLSFVGQNYSYSGLDLCRDCCTFWRFLKLLFWLEDCDQGIFHGMRFAQLLNCLLCYIPIQRIYVALSLTGPFLQEPIERSCSQFVQNTAYFCAMSDQVP